MTKGIEGGIEVRVRLEGRRIAHVEIASSRPVTACRVLEGRTPAEAVALLPRLFAICGTAQTHAALAACETALGFEVSPTQHAARALLLAAETAREHAWRALVDWPAWSGEPPAAEAIKTLRAALAAVEPHLYPEGDRARLGGGRLRPDVTALGHAIATVEAVIRDPVLGTPWPADAEAFDSWCRAGATPPARALAFVLDRGLAGFGASDVAALPDLDPAALDRVLAADADAGFAARPTWNGDAFETGPLARATDDPAVVALAARDANGLIPRFAARLAELVAAPARMRAALPALADDDGATPGRDRGTGLAAIEMARGRLVHRVEIADGRVRRYQVVAPTEWNFHPEGALARGLRGAPLATTADARRAAGLLVTALDPCVAYEVTVEGS